MKWGTRLLHNGNEVDPVTGAASVPLYQASTFHQPDVDTPVNYDYARSGNPTRFALEQTIAELEEGRRGFAFASGMAAISTVFLLFSSGDHLVVSRDLYGGTYRVLTKVLSRLGISATFVDTTDLDQMEEAIQPCTRAIYIETPSNPTLKVTDLAKSSEIAGRHGLLTIVDNTFLTPCFQRPLHLGADIVIHSATKFISGHSDVVSGLVVVKDELMAERMSFLQNSLGSVLGVQDSWLTMRGLKTLKARMELTSASAMKIAEYLQELPGVKRVYYTGLPDHPGKCLQEAQATGHGAVLSFELSSGEAVRHVLSRVRLPLIAVSLGAVESILSYPAKMSHAAMSEEERQSRGVTDGLLRLSVGLEETEDLIQDLEQALKKSRFVSIGQE
ncbi:aminotransferase class I/II-fold pyridoxal phosphate-dependent enzyme [Kroppenstedtia pulmonis]|uniref:cysteine-S-conjugate beta-lyase n=1 Tax=Kroppenstedtia pulmonis TaxID=1380685 RepID=A0A7D3Y2I6_9BACL|nr:aminotransferase class I/II-fold pyridoxal phosphate-dependent enzyme [Kroppenstedtia pulmonis]QKG84983.1 aminotransferase class I/II-fold pyridoxal phosphate-dependent enzyme [Kroppenstedtia pulmonis]